MSSLSRSVEQNARNTQMTTRVTEGARVIATCLGNTEKEEMCEC